MELIKLNSIDTLVNKNMSPAISLFMPTFRTGTEVKQNAIRFKNLIAQSREKLKKTGMGENDIESILQPVLENIDNDFWQHQQDGMAMFISNDVCYYFNLYHDPGEFVIVSGNFYIKPVIEAITEDRIFYLLALNQHKLRLYRGSRYHIDAVNLSGIPTSIEEMLQYENPEKSIQYHTGTVGAGKRPAVFHGQGTGSDAGRRKKDIQRFFHLVDGRLREKGYYKKMKNENAVLILAGIDELIPLYRDANSFSDTLNKYVNKNPDELNLNDLHEEAWEIMDDLITGEKEALIKKFIERRSDQKTSDDDKEIIKSAAEKRIDVLFFNPNSSLPGFYDEDKNSVVIKSNDHDMESDLINFAALETLRSNGKVIAVEGIDKFSEGSLSAIYRY